MANIFRRTGIHTATTSNTMLEREPWWQWESHQGVVAGGSGSLGGDLPVKNHTHARMCVVHTTSSVNIMNRSLEAREASQYQATVICLI